MNEIQIQAIREALERPLKRAHEAYLMSALMKADAEPEIVALAPLYQTIGDAWYKWAAKLAAAQIPPKP